jgi:hypothetical protein
MRGDESNERASHLSPALRATGSVRSGGGGVNTLARDSVATAAIASAMAFGLACGEVVRPIQNDGDAASFDSIANWDGGVADSVPSDSTHPDDVPRLRNVSIIGVSMDRSAFDSIDARLLGDEAVPSSIDHTVGSCRTYNMRALPEVRVGLLTVRRGTETYSIPPSTMFERNLYSYLFPSASPAGTLFTIGASGNDQFPRFALEERSPVPLTITNPPQRINRVFSAETPVLLEWIDDGSNDSVRVVFVGLETPNGTPIVTSCIVPIGDRRFEFPPVLLRRYESFTGSRRIDVMRARIARGVFGNAPIMLTIQNASTTGWISFND